jgi:hypothetical protein
MSPPSPLAATIEVLTPSVGPGDELPYRITNVGSIDLICGLQYRLERETTDGWIHMNPGMAFRAIGFGVPPGENRELTAMIPAKGPAGRYRLSAAMTGDHAQGNPRLSVRFDVHPVC